jgi:hypothetical protein
MLGLCTSSCHNNSIGPNSFLPSGRITLSSNRPYEFAGFSFSKGGVISADYFHNKLPDFMLSVETDSNGNIVSGGLIDPNPSKPRNIFRLTAQSSDTTSARRAFDSLAVAPESNYTYLARELKANQVWVVKSQDNKYGKLLILNVTGVWDSSYRGALNINAETTFDWVYQPDGSNRF